MVLVIRLQLVVLVIRLQLVVLVIRLQLVDFDRTTRISVIMQLMSKTIWCLPTLISTCEFHFWLRDKLRLCVRSKYASFYRRFQSFQSFSFWITIFGCCLNLFQSITKDWSIGAKLFLYLKLFICCPVWHPWVALKGTLSVIIDRGRQFTLDLYTALYCNEVRGKHHSPPCLPAHAARNRQKASAEESG